MLGHRTLYMHALAVMGLFREVETLVDLHTIPLFHANGWGRPQASTMLVCDFFHVDCAVALRRLYDVARSSAG